MRAGGFFFAISHLRRGCGASRGHRLTMATDMTNTTSERGFTTAILHSDRASPIEHGALHKPLHLSVAYGYADAHELAAVFQGRQPGYAYGRQGKSQRFARTVQTALQNATIEQVFQTGLHEFLTRFISDNARVGGAITEQYLA